MQKQMIWVGMIVGSFVGGLIPMLWGADMFSLSSVIFTALGGFAGIYVGLKMG